jgi:hypothetical protein
MKKVSIILAVGIFLAMTVTSASAYEAFQGHTGVIIYDELNAENVYTLLAPGSETISYLIDMEGYIVHLWDTEFLVADRNPGSESDTNQRPGLHDRLLNNGNLLRGFRPTTFNDQGEVITRPRIGGSSGGVQEFTWDGELVWQYILASETAVQHHSFYRMPNGNTLILGWEKVECADATALGRNPGTCVEENGLWPDYIEEVNQAGEIVWEWHVWDHIGDGPGQFNINALTDPVILNDHDWTHGNTVEYDQVNDLVMTNFRNWGELFVIDHNTTTEEAAGPAGEIMFRWGNPSSYLAGDPPGFNDDGDQQLFGSHCAVFLGTGDNINFGTLGNILVFDNGWNRPQGNRSRSVEIAPNLDDWEATEVVWSFQAGDQGSFYTAFQGATQRLPGGNTFVTSTGEGHLFQVTAGEDPEVVWDFVNPRRVDGVPQCFHFDGVDSSIHRAHQYSPNHPGLVGKDLSRKGHIAGNCVQIWSRWQGGVDASAGFSGEMSNFQASPVAGIISIGGTTDDYYPGRP